MGWETEKYDDTPVRNSQDATRTVTWFVTTQQCS